MEGDKQKFTTYDSKQQPMSATLREILTVRWTNRQIKNLRRTARAKKLMEQK